MHIAIISGKLSIGVPIGHSPFTDDPTCVYIQQLPKFAGSLYTSYPSDKRQRLPRLPTECTAYALSSDTPPTSVSPFFCYRAAASTPTLYLKVGPQKLVSWLGLDSGVRLFAYLYLRTLRPDLLQRAAVFNVVGRIKVLGGFLITTARVGQEPIPLRPCLTGDLPQQRRNTGGSTDAHNTQTTGDSHCSIQDALSFPRLRSPWIPTYQPTARITKQAAEPALVPCSSGKQRSVSFIIAERFLAIRLVKCADGGVGPINLPHASLFHPGGRHHRIPPVSAGPLA